MSVWLDFAPTLLAWSSLIINKVISFYNEINIYFSFNESRRRSKLYLHSEFELRNIVICQKYLIGNKGIYSSIQRMLFVSLYKVNSLIKISVLRTNRKNKHFKRMKSRFKWNYFFFLIFKEICILNLDCSLMMIC